MRHASDQFPDIVGSLQAPHPRSAGLSGESSHITLRQSSIRFLWPARKNLHAETLSRGATSRASAASWRCFPVNLSTFFLARCARRITVITDTAPEIAPLNGTSAAPRLRVHKLRSRSKNLSPETTPRHNALSQAVFRERSEYSPDSSAREAWGRWIVRAQVRARRRGRPPSISRVIAPSTMLRMVPLARFAEEETERSVITRAATLMGRGEAPGIASALRLSVIRRYAARNSAPTAKQA